MNKVISSIIIASCSVVATSSAWACNPMQQDQPCDKFFSSIDTKKDGVISKKEFEAFHSKHFKEIDTNHDGKLTHDEFHASHAPMHKHHEGLIAKPFEAADTDHDGAVSREEAKAMPMLLQNFDEIDTNKDGKISQEEIKAMIEQHHPVAKPEVGDKAPIPEKK